MSKLQSAEFTTPGADTWTVPTGVKLCWPVIQGGGAGGGHDLNASLTGGQGGGSGELVSGIPLVVTPGASIALVVGAGGAGGFYANHTAPSGGAVAQVGTSSSFGPFTALAGGILSTGGAPSTNAAFGGGVNGGLQTNTTFPIFSDTFGAADGSRWFGGAGGGASPSTGLPKDGTPGGPSGGQLLGGTGGTAAPVVTTSAGGGGAATIWGPGGNGGDSFANGTAAANYGSGGGGAGGTNVALGVGPFHDGAAGEDGYVAVFWLEP